MGYQSNGAIIDQAQAATFTTLAWDAAEFTGFSIHAVYGAITGTLILQANNDPAFWPNDWVTSAAASFAAIAGAGRQFLEVTGAHARHYRLVYTHSSGTGSLRVVFYSKNG